MNVTELVARARKAQRALEDLDQKQVDDIVTAVAWVGVKNAEPLAKLAVEETGLGNVADKAKKNRRKTMGTLRDLRGARSVGVIKDDPATGITEIAKPVGVVGAITPVTNPGATPINNIKKWLALAEMYCPASAVNSVAAKPSNKSKAVHYKPGSRSTPTASFLVYSTGVS